MILTISLLVLSNIFMTFAWYGHLKGLNSSSLWVVILLSWSIALFEYCFQVPANRIGYRIFTLPQLKIMQEAITLIVFLGFSVFFMKIKLNLNYLWASFCMIGAVYFMFKSK